MKDMAGISTGGRIFAAQLIRDVAARESEGASLLSPGATRWREAFTQFAQTIHKIQSQTKRGKYFNQSCRRLQIAQSKSACLLNAFLSRSRSGLMELLTYERSVHPLVEKTDEGIVVMRYMARLRRNGEIRVAFGTPTAFVSWHALARIAERSPVDIFKARGIVAYCGIAGILMRESEKHIRSAINLTTEHTICIGTLRYADLEHGRYGFFDVITVLPFDVPDWLVEHRAQGCAIAEAARKYIKAEVANPHGYADDIAVLPFRESDYVTLQLKTVGPRTRDYEQQNAVIKS